MGQKITIKEVAKQANVSVATVSRVLNGRDRVSKETKEKVLKVVKELNYVPNTTAVSMITKQTQMLAVVVPDIENPFYTAVIKGAVSVARQEGYYVFVFSTNDNVKEESIFFESAQGRNVDGVILVGAHKEEAFYKSINKPVVLVDRYIEESGLDGVVINNFRGAYDATTHFIENGHRNIAVIIGPQDFNDGTERYWGYEQALKDHNVEPVNEYYKEGDWTEKHGYESTFELMNGSNPPSAILGANNMICQGAIKALRDLKLEIGKDISLIGFDENDIAEFVEPRVSVVKRPTHEMGVHATEILIQKLSKKESTSTVPKKVTLGCELLKFGSVRNLRNGG